MNRSGENNSFFGKHHSEKTKEKMRLAHLGKKHSLEWREKMSIKMKGRILTPEWKKKISIANKGKKFTEEIKQKLSEARKGKYGGEKCPAWRGGVSVITNIIKGLRQYKEWRLTIFKRDRYTCQKCNKHIRNIEAHHIKEFSKIIQENNIKTSEQALNCNELWNTDNGITLCKECHDGIRKHEQEYYPIFINILNQQKVF